MTTPAEDLLAIPVCSHHPDPAAEPITDQAVLAAMLALHNPNAQPMGIYTGRCGHCGSISQDWDTNWIACLCCGFAMNTEHIPPRRIENGTGRDLGPAW